MKPRTTAPTSEPYYFPSTSYGSCAWYCYYRMLELWGKFPCYRTANKDKGFNDGKLWVKYYNDTDYELVDVKNAMVGDTLVFDGNCGHVIVLEKDNGDGTFLISQYNMDIARGFSTATYKLGEILKGKVANTGKPLGAIHFKGNVQEDNYKKLYEQAQAKLDKIKAILG